MKISVSNFRFYPTWALDRPRSLPLLLAVSFLLGSALTLTMLPVQVILGNAGFWDFPHGTIPGGVVDMAQTLVGYRYCSLAPWTLPILNIPNLVPPAGTNLLWLDAVPLLCLIGKVAATASGPPISLIGSFLFVCFALPGVAMTAAFWVAGQRTLIGAIAAAALADSMPFLLFEWGHVALCAQFLLVAAIALYLLSQQRPSDKRVGVAWIALLLITILTSNYLFVMLGGIWFAALAQRFLDRRSMRPHLAIEASASIGIVACVAWAMGLLTSDLRFGGSHDFGIFSMNLGTPFVPQLSGVLPPFANYWIGMRSQVFNYLGIGVLLILVFGLPALVRTRRRWARSHVVLFGILCGFLLFALSNKITLGSRTLLQIPLPEWAAYGLGAFRASGRFFWPIGYVVTIAGTLLILRSFNPLVASAILMVAAILQVVDTFPQRRAIAASTMKAVSAVVDRHQVANIMAQSRGVMMFPTTGCVVTALGGDKAQASQVSQLEQATVELQMLAAHMNLPINSAITDRIQTDCTAETTTRHGLLRPDTAYFYLTDFTPGADQFSGHDPGLACRMIGWLRYCFVPGGGKIDAGHVAGFPPFHRKWLPPSSGTGHRLPPQAAARTGQQTDQPERASGQHDRRAGRNIEVVGSLQPTDR